MDRLHESILRGDVHTFLGIVQQNEDIIKQIIPGSLSSTILHLAARFGQVDLAKEILKLSPGMVSVVNEKLETPLHDACRAGMLKTVSLLMETDPCVVYKLNHEDESPLFVASRKGRLDVVKYLLQFPDLLVSKVDHGSTTSLHAAASGGYTDVLKEILKTRPDFAWKKDQEGCTPLHLSCKEGHLDITREFLRFNSDLTPIQDNDGRTPLHWAASKGRVSIINEILSVSLKSTEMITIYGETVLHVGVKNNQCDAVKHLTKTLIIRELLNRPDNDGNTVLHIAIAGKLMNMVACLLELGVHVNAVNLKGQTALDVYESDGSNSGAPSILVVLQKSGAKRCNQLVPPISRELQQIEPYYSPTPSSTRKTAETLEVHHQHRRRRETYLENQIEGLRNARNTITVVAVLIATVAFAVGINPPGGSNQMSGDAIKDSHTSFKVFVVCNIVVLFLSLGIVIFLVSIVPFRRKSMTKLLFLAHKVMWLSTSFLAAAYIAAMWTIVQQGRGTRWEFMATPAIGGGCTLAIFVGLGVLLADNWVRKWEWRRSKDSPSSSNSRVEEMRMMRRGSRDFSSNSDVDSSDRGGYHLY